jgi:hypothetical protein
MKKLRIKFLFLLHALIDKTKDSSAYYIVLLTQQLNQVLLNPYFDQLKINLS